MSSSFQNEIPPARINLKLDVGKGDAKKKVELPLNLLVCGDFSSQEHDDRVTEREKIAINKNNFTQVMESMNISASYNVDDKLSGKEDSEIPVSLKIKNMNSFKPENVASEIPSMSRLLAARNLLKDLKSNILDNRSFRKRLEEMTNNLDSMKELQEQLSKIVPDEKADEEGDK